MNVAHTGHLPDDRLVPPLVRRWSVASVARQLLAADGRVYGIGSRVFALDQRTGKRLWTTWLDHPLRAVYDGGRLFVVTHDRIHALDAATGAVQWTGPELGGATGVPVASGGAVYVAHGQSGTNLLALAASDGRQLWSRGVGSADIPALDGAAIYLAHACGAASAVSRADGSTLWHFRPGCSGAGPREAPALFDGTLYHPDRHRLPDGRRAAPAMLNAADGTLVGRHAEGTPVFVDGMRVYGGDPDQTGDRPLVARRAVSGRVAWRAPKLWPHLAVGHTVYGVGARYPWSTHFLVARNGETGALLWRGRLPEDTHGGSLAAAPGLVLVATTKRIIAYESRFQPRPRGIGLGTDATDAFTGESRDVVGVLGRDLRRGKTSFAVHGAHLRAGRFRTFGRHRTFRDGGFHFGLRMFRNMRLRVQRGKARSRTLRLFAWPEVMLGRAGQAGGKVRLPVGVRSPRTNLAGRRFVLYHSRYGSSHARRIASGRLSGRRGRARTTLSFRPLKRLGRRDLLCYCVKGQLRVGLGRPSAFTRRCGARRLPNAP